MPVVRQSTRKWTPEMDRELCNMWDYGIHKSEIAERMGVTICSAENRYRKLKKAQKNDG